MWNLMLNPEEAIRKEKKIYKSSYCVSYIFKCKNPDCSNEIKTQSGQFKKASGFCNSCCQKGRPYEATYNELSSTVHARGLHEVTMTYEEFLSLVQITECHYCKSKIVWHPHTRKNGKNVKGSRAYKLDRKNNNRGYHLDNVVVCCWICNSAKGSRYTYEDWYGMTEYLRNKK